ncbi:MAG TPA: glycosyltransferase family 2 protein [Nitrospirales bacterium]|nr:glycosyltransferase family 2 protein [Nitrospirales bacterium]
MEGIPTTQKLCSIIIVTYNSSSCIGACLSSLLNISDIELVVVDNDSKDGTAAKLQKEFPQITLIALQNNIGFGRACNIGLAASSGSFALFLNPDTIANEKAIRTLVQFYEKHPRVGIIGGRLVDPCGKPLQSMGDTPSLTGLVLDKPLAWVAKRVGAQGVFRRILGRCSAKFLMPPEAEPVAWVSGAFLCCRRSIWDTIGGFDENFFLYYEDVDLCLRAKQAGWEVWHVPEAVVEHQSGASFGGDLFKQKEIYYANQYYFFRKHFGRPIAWALWILQSVYSRLGMYRRLGTDRIGRGLL